MKTLISAKDIEELLRRGGDPKSLPSDALLTPSARDRLRELEGIGAKSTAARSESSTVKSVTSKSSPKEIEAFFNSPAIYVLKEQLCDVGRRLWQRAYVDG